MPVRRAAAVAPLLPYLHGVAEIRRRTANHAFDCEGSCVIFSERYTDAGNGRYFARVFGQDVRYVREQDAWYVNVGTHWVRDVDGDVVRLGKAAVSDLFENLNDGRPKELRDAQVKHAMNSESAPRLAAALKMLQSEEGITIGQSELDRDPFLLGVRNGVIDLRTGGLRQPRGDEYITRQAGCEYSPHTRCDLWQACVLRWMDGDVALVEYLQRALGYSLTGDTREQCFFIPYGSGANGKSVFMRAVRELSGGYGADASISTFIDRRGDSATNDLAALAGARLVSASESTEGARLAEGLVKALTGGEAIRARFLFREFFEYTPTFKLWLGTNHKPRVRGNDHAIWRRIRLIPFRVTIPDSEQDKTLQAKLRLELPGILNWAIEGCLAWQRFGLESPAAVVSATDEYRREQDRLGQWIDECCAVSPHAIGRTSALHQDYRRWAEGRSEQPMSLTAFSLALGERGFEKQEGRHAAYRGIGLIVPEAADNMLPMRARAN